MWSDSIIQSRTATLNRQMFLTRSQFIHINDFFWSIDSSNITKQSGSLMEILCACLMGSECCMTMCDLSWKITCSVALVVAAVLQSSSDPTLPLSHPHLLQLTALSRSWSSQERERQKTKRQKDVVAEFLNTTQSISQILTSRYLHN